MRIYAASDRDIVLKDIAVVDGGFSLSPVAEWPVQHAMLAQPPAPQVLHLDRQYPDLCCLRGLGVTGDDTDGQRDSR